MYRSLLVFFSVILALNSGCARDKGKSGAGNEDMAAWKTVGIGTAIPSPDGNGYRLTEGSGSQGVTFVSSKAYGKNMTLSFKIMPEKREGVCVVFLSAADSAGQLSIPPDNDGGIGVWSEGSVHNYMIAFHTAYHQPNLFIRKNPGLVDIVQIPDPAGEEKWYEMEIGRNEARIWVKVNGETVLEGVDPEAGGLPGGHVGIRLRGPGDGSFSCLVKDVAVKE